MRGNEYKVVYWTEGERRCYWTKAPESAPKGLYRYFRAYSLMSGEEYFLGNYIHFWNCYGGMGSTDGGVIRGLQEEFPGCEILIIDSPELPRY